MTVLWLPILSALAAEHAVPGDHATVQDAIDASSPGDTIVIAAGNFTDDVVVHVDDLTIRGAGREATILGPGADLWAFTYDSGVSGTVEDLTIDAQGQRSVLNANSAGTDLTLRRVALVDGLSGVDFHGRDLVVEDCTFRGSDGGSALHTEGSGDLIVRDSTFCENHSSYRGGALSVENHASVLISGSVLVGNEADYGAGVWLAVSADLVNNTLYGNHSVDIGAAVDVYGGDVTLINNIIAGHTGAMAVQTRASAMVTGASGHNLFHDNSDGDSDEPYATNDLQLDPMLASALAACDTFDGTLLDGSPAIGAGSADGLFDDIGAYDVVDGDGDGARAEDDCDDTDASVYPGAYEVAGDGVDQSCDGIETCLFDGDGDGARTDVPLEGNDLDCSDPNEALASAPLDCDDTDANASPTGVEVCDGVDNDCNVAIDDGLDVEIWYPDDDGDGFGVANGREVASCGDVPNHVSNDLDCNDGEAAMSPGLPEVPCNGIDDDCDPVTLDDVGCDTGPADTGTPDADTDTDTDTDADTDADTDTDTDTDADADTDADTDPTTTSEDTQGLSSACGCTPLDSRPASITGPWTRRR